MAGFRGFEGGKERQVKLPESVFSDMLPVVDNLDELKLALLVFWRLSQKEGRFVFVTEAELLGDAACLVGPGGTPEKGQRVIRESLERAVSRGILLQAVVEPGKGGEAYAVYFLNTPAGRAALEAIASGNWKPGPARGAAVQATRPNIFALYEQNIGPLTPILADTLRDAEADYPAEWIEDAFRIAAEKNIRNWRFIAAVLRSWKEKGRHEQNRGKSQKTGGRYDEGDFADFIDN